MATLNGTILKSDGTAPNPWQCWPKGCPVAGPVPVTAAGENVPQVAHSHIYFFPKGTPYLDGSSDALVTTAPLRARIDCQTGAFTLTINAGEYRCQVGADSFDVLIPADVGAFDLQNVVTSEMNYQPAASSAYQGAFPSQAADFILPANAVNNPGAPVATGWTQNVQGPGKFLITAVLTILATTRGNGAADNEIYTAFLQDTTNNVLLGQETTIENIFTGAQGQLLLTATVTIAGPGAILLEVYAAGNPNPADQTAAPDSVGTIIMEQSSISISRLQ